MKTRFFFGSTPKCVEVHLVLLGDTSIHCVVARIMRPVKENELRVNPLSIDSTYLVLIRVFVFFEGEPFTLGQRLYCLGASHVARWRRRLSCSGQSCAAWTKKKNVQTKYVDDEGMANSTGERLQERHGFQLNLIFSKYAKVHLVLLSDASIHRVVARIVWPATHKQVRVNPIYIYICI